MLNQMAGLGIAPLSGVKAMAQTSGTERVFRSMCFGGRHGYIKLEKWVEVGRKARTVQGRVDLSIGTRTCLVLSGGGCYGQIP
ncbi:hypothetical protein JCGZ_11893 [Jatropha curcas]|uniref:Uncharacterized protein n=1 Tax=Jatropha curcas TaxID=180498 RepID=A0A067LMF5_JATCU|nr:hypothetical protein JCGZ_11893 [Jatropha curcas]